MSRRIRVALLAVAVGALAIGIAACRKARTTTVVHDFHLALSFRGPVTGKFVGTNMTASGGVCFGTNSWLMSFDPAGDGPYTKRFLFGPSGDLVGCGGGVAPCADSHIAMTLSTQARVMLEGLSVTTAQYGAGTKADVVCRGVADPAIDPTSLVALDSTSLAARFDLLRVDDFNGMFAAPWPNARWAAASLEIPEPVTARTATGGIVVVAGGNIVVDGSYVDARGSAGLLDDRIWEFRPSTLSFTTAGGVLSAPRNYLSATAYWAGTPPTQPAVLFAGGEASGGVSDHYDAFVVDGPVTSSQPGAGAAMLGVYVPSMGPSGEQAVVLLGGCGVNGNRFNDPSTSPMAPARIFRPSTGQVTFGAAVLQMQGGVGLKPASVCYSAGGRTGGAAAPQIWFGTGYVDTNASITTEDAFPGDTWWTLEAGSSGTPVIAAGYTPGVPRYRSTAVSIGTSGVAVFGGWDPGQGANWWAGLPDWFYYRPDLGNAASGRHTMTETPGRNSAASAQLLDGRVLLTGGMNLPSVNFGLGVPSTDILQPPTSQPAVFSTDWAFVQGPDMATGRFGHTMTRVDGTRSWINGSIVVAGLGVDTSLGPELFVPAYQCGGTAGDEPIRLTDQASLSQLGLVDACDRGRASQPLSDPLKP